MKIRLETKGPAKHYGILGLFDLTCSIQRVWRGDGRNFPTWRHVTIAIRSPLLRQPATLNRNGKARWGWWPLRFGWGCGNLYLGPLFILTTFGRHHPPLAYHRWGPFEWARQPSMDEYLGCQRRMREGRA